MIRVLLVDDDALVRSGLRMMLAGAAQVEVVGEAEDGRGVLAAVDRHRPDVVLMDIRMPQLDGIEATRLLRAQPAPPAVIVLTTFDADELVLRALRAGAAGFLLKDTPPAEIVRAIEHVHAGEGTLSPGVARRLIALVAGDGEAARRREDARALLEGLSAREHEVALAVGRGCANAEIAAELHMSVATVKAHVSRRAGQARRREPGPGGAAGPRCGAELGRVRMTEETGQAAGVHEHGALARFDVAVGHGGGEARHRLGGVDRIEDQALAAAGVRDRLAGGVRELLVARADLVEPHPQALGARAQLGGEARDALDRVGHGAGIDAEHPLGAEPGNEPRHRPAGAYAHDDVRSVRCLLLQLSRTGHVAAGADRARSAVGQHGGARDLRRDRLGVAVPDDLGAEDRVERQVARALAPELREPRRRLERGPPDAEVRDQARTAAGG